MTVILDAGALIALERRRNELFSRILTEQRAGRPVRTHGGVVGQAWRSGARQARLSLVLGGLEVVPLDVTLGREAGELLAAAGTSDVVDAALVALAMDGDRIWTSDVEDMIVLIEAAGVDATVLQV